MLMPLPKLVSNKRYQIDLCFVDNELTTKWLNRLRATSNTAVSREQHAQLESILNYYSKTSSGTSELKPIDWATYEKNIHTPDVVNKIQAKYDDFMAAEYDVGGAVAKCGVRTEAMKSLDTAMHYNYQLWMVHYLMHLDQIETLHNIGDVTELSKQEMTEMFPEAEQYNAAQQETGNLSP